MSFKTKRNIFFYLWIISSISLSLFSQNRETLYKLRDGDRWEGVKRGDYKEVAGKLELASLLFYQDGWRQETDEIETASIWFMGKLGKDLNVSVYNRLSRYFMDPYPNKISQDSPYSFQWPMNILSEINLPVNQLSAIAKTRIKETWVYLPIYFNAADIHKNELILEITLFPKKAIWFDLELLTADGGKVLESWQDNRIEKDQLKVFKYPVTHNTRQVLKLVATEKENGLDSRSHQFWILIEKAAEI